MEIGAIVDRPPSFAADEMAIAGVFISIDIDGSIFVERGYVRPEDEPVSASDPDASSNNDRDDASESGGAAKPDATSLRPIDPGSDDEGSIDGEASKPLPDRLVAELTAWRTLALQDAFARSPTTAFATVLHAMVLGTYYHSSRDSCLQLSLNKVSFGLSPTDLRDSPPAKAIAERYTAWADRLPDDEEELWEALLSLDATDQAALFAHCASLAVNAQQEVVPKYDNGRISKYIVERRVAHSHVLARAVGLDLAGAGWRPTVASYFGAVTKPRILADVTEAKGAPFAQMIDHLKKPDMAREAERLMEDAGWLPEPMRTPAPAGTAAPVDLPWDDASAPVAGDATGGVTVDADNDDDRDHAASAA